MGDDPLPGRQGQGKPFIGLDGIDLAGRTLLDHDAEHVLGHRLAGIGGLSVPVDGLGVVAGRSVATVIKVAQGKLGVGVPAQVGGQLVPLGCPVITLLGPFAVGEHGADGVLRADVPFLGRLGVPAKGLGQVLGLGLAMMVKPGQFVLGADVAGPGFRF